MFLNKQILKSLKKDSGSLEKFPGRWLKRIVRVRAVNGTALKTDDDSVMEITTLAQEHLKKSLSD